MNALSAEAEANSKVCEARGGGGDGSDGDDGGGCGGSGVFYAVSRW